MKLDITDTHFIELHKKGYTIDMVVILGWANKNLSLDHIIKSSTKIKAIHTTMVRKGLLTKDNKITEAGINILTFVSKKTNKQFSKPKVEGDSFDEWWSIFPSNDKFEINGKTFGPTRALKTKKDGCRLLFNNFILEKKYTKEEIINATLYDINLKKERSYKKGSNQLKYIQNSHTYLLQETFQGYIDLGKPSPLKQFKNKGSIDI
jgi:hypothetical protein